jgi:putative SOS response-associated peptidase YedK
MTEIRSILENVNKRYKKYKVKPGDKCPNDLSPVLSACGSELRYEPLVWGIPGDTAGETVYNANAETVLTGHKFRQALLENPVVFPVSCFYEWKGVSNKILNLYMCYDKHMDPLYIAGFYKDFAMADGQLRRGAVILTTVANKSMMPYQYRMPVLLHKNEVKAWMDGHYVEYFLHRPPRAVQVDLVASEVESRASNGAGKRGFPPRATACDTSAVCHL